MADLYDALAGALASEVKQEQSTDWRSILANSLALGAQGAAQGFAEANPSDYGSQIAASLVGGLATGYGSGRRRNIANQITGNFADAMRGAQSGDYASLVDALTDKGFDNTGNIGAALSLHNFQLGQDLEQRAREKAIDARAKGVGEYRAIDGDIGNFILGRAPASAIKVGDMAGATQSIANREYAKQAAGNEADLKYKPAIAFQTERAKAMGGDYVSEKEVSQAIYEAQQDLEKLPASRDFEYVNTSYRSMMEAVKDDSTAADLELVRAAIQVIEPGLAVREGEQRAVSASQSIPDAWKGQMLNAMTGQGRLRDDLRQGLIRLADRRYRAQRDVLSGRVELMKDSISSVTGRSPDEIKLTPYDLNKIVPDPLPVSALNQNQAQTKTVGGKTYQRVNGGWQEIQ